MRESLKCWMLTICGAALGATLCVASAEATPPSGFAATTMALGRLERLDVSTRALLPDGGVKESTRNLWLSFQRTSGPSDLYVQSNVWAPGGSTGWHTHPGHSLIVVTEGVITAYEGDDPTCTPQVYAAGMGFVDPGGSHVHVLRNEGRVEARTIAVQLLPVGAARRIDATASSNCPF